jgi:hypothetical protein
LAGGRRQEAGGSWYDGGDVKVVVLSKLLSGVDVKVVLSGVDVKVVSGVDAARKRRYMRLHVKMYCGGGS